MAAAVVDQDIRMLAIREESHNIVVEAGAGTGKTTLMVERTVYALLERQIPLARLALITFMEKAAGEVKERLAIRLQQESLGADPAKARLAAAALEDLPGAPITTIHGFCLRILQSLGYHAPVPINFQVMDTYGREQLFVGTFERWMSEDAQAAARVGQLLDWGLPFERFQDIARFLSMQADLPEYAAASPSVAWAQNIASEAAVRAERAEQEADADDQGRMQIHDILRFSQALSSTGQSGWYKALTAWHVSAPKGNRRKWRDPDALREQKAWIAALKESLENFRQALADYMLSELLDILREQFLPFWKRTRWAAGRLTFDDLLWETRRYLQTHAKDAGWFEMIMVDEFQDTDAVQAEIIFRALDQGCAEDWLDAEIPPGSLFVVGDPKQSIYRFRGADVETYQRVREKMVSGGAKSLAIVQNFRSRPEIIEPVNMLFASNWPARFDPSRPYVSPYTPLVPYIGASGGGMNVAGGPLDLSVFEERLLQADLVASYIERATGPAALTVRDLATGELRLADFGDVALLTPSRTGLSVYQDALVRRRIPVAPEGGVRFFERDEIRGFQQWLSALRKPWQPLHTVAWLSSPWVGISHRELAEHTAAGGNFQYLETQAGGLAAILSLFTQLKAWHRQWWAWRVEDFFWALYDWSPMARVLVGRKDSGALANLEKMADLCRNLGDSWGADVFSQWLEDKVRNREKEEEGALLQVDSAVHMSTVHRSKGLEWPIVIVANWQSQTSRNHPGILLEGSRAALRVGDLQSRDWEFLYQEDRVKSDAERERLYYVALTRARDHLLVVDTFPENTASSWSLYQRLADGPKPS
jgi:ATP-dependent helicase/nuclease subunit A